jgi:hypothetical protein
MEQLASLRFKNVKNVVVMWNVRMSSFWGSVAISIYRFDTNVLIVLSREHFQKSSSRWEVSVRHTGFPPHFLRDLMQKNSLHPSLFTRTCLTLDS